MEIKLSNCNLSVIIDAEDLNKILSHSECWTATFRMNRQKIWVIVDIMGHSCILGKSIQLSRLIIDYYGPLNVDHKDRNKLNNKKENLRVVTISQNNQNRVARIGCRSKYKCVTKVFGLNKPWRVRVEANGKVHYGGNFVTEQEAAMKANELMKLLHGDFAYQNIID